MRPRTAAVAGPFGEAMNAALLNASLPSPRRGNPTRKLVPCALVALRWAARQPCKPRTNPRRRGGRGDLRPGVLGPVSTAEGRPDDRLADGSAAGPPGSSGLSCPKSRCSRTIGIRRPRWCARLWRRCVTWPPQGCVDVVLCYSPDRLARKFAYQALLIEEFARACGWSSSRACVVTSPEDQLMVQFQGMFAEYEKAQLMERDRLGKAHRARCGSVNVLGGAPFGYRYINKTADSGASYEIVDHRGGDRRRAVLPLHRRRRFHRRPDPLAHKRKRPHPNRQGPLGPLGGLGHAAQPPATRAPRCSARRRSCRNRQGGTGGPA